MNSRISDKPDADAEREREQAWQGSKQILELYVAMTLLTSLATQQTPLYRDLAADITELPQSLFPQR